MSGQGGEDENLVVRDDSSEYEDFDGDDTMENMLSLFLFNRKDAKVIDWFQLISFIIFFFVNVGCVSFNFYKALTIEADTERDIFKHTINKDNKNVELFQRDFKSIFKASNTTNTSVIMTTETKVLYVAEFSVIALFLIIAIYNYTLLSFKPSSKSYLSNAANFTRLVREFSCFSLVPLFNVNTIMGIYTDIANTFDEQKKKYADRSTLWNGIWGMGTKEVQKSNTELELALDTSSHDELNDENNDEPLESRFKRFKHSRTFLSLVSVAIYTGFFVSLLIMVALAFFAFIALLIKTRHVGRFIESEDNIYKWFNFITFIMNIASLTQHSPAIKLIIYELKVLTKKAHYNKYRRNKQNRIKENNALFDADKDEEGIQPPKIIIHRKKITKTEDETESEKLVSKSDLNSLNAGKSESHHHHHVKSFRHSEKSNTVDSEAEKLVNKSELNSLNVGESDSHYHHFKNFKHSEKSNTVDSEAEKLVLKSELNSLSVEESESHHHLKRKISRPSEKSNTVDF